MLPRYRPRASAPSGSASLRPLPCAAPRRAQSRIDLTRTTSGSRRTGRCCSSGWAGSSFDTAEVTSPAAACSGVNRVGGWPGLAHGAALDFACRRGAEETRRALEHHVPGPFSSRRRGGASTAHRIEVVVHADLHLGDIGVDLEQGAVRCPDGILAEFFVVEFCFGG